MDARRRRLAAAAAAAIGLPATLRAAARVLRLGYQRSSTLAIWLKGRGTLERALAPLGLEIAWREFSSGLPLALAIDAGDIDLGADVADAVPPFALAGGARLAYVAMEAPSPQAQAIVVKTASPLTRLAELKGRRVAFARGAGAHYLVLASLLRVDLGLRDIVPVYLPPSEGRKAFDDGSVAAWGIWDPFLAAAQRHAQARALPESVGAAAYRRLYLAAVPFLRARPEVVQAVYAGLREAAAWVKGQPAAAVEWHAAAIGMDVGTVQAAYARRSYRVEPVDAACLVEQQRIADIFATEGVVPRRAEIASVPVWRPAVS